MRKVYFNFVALLLAGCLAFAAQASTNLYSTLNYYGFTDDRQKAALVAILEAAAVPDAKDFLSKQNLSQQELAHKLLYLVRETQEKFTIRKGAEERWDVKTAPWMQEPSLQMKIMTDMDALNMLAAIPSKFKASDAVCILGATTETMQARLKYAENLYLQNKLATRWVVLLVGERYATADKPGVILDGTEEELSAIAVKVGKDRASITETDLMRVLYANTKFSENFKDSTVVLDTPRGELPRPTTETTVQAFVQWLQSHPDVRTVTFVSNQPHVDYQRDVIAQVLARNNVHIEFEVIGSKFNPTTIANKSDRVNYFVQALGRRIWAATPLVLSKVQADLNDPSIKADYVALFKQQPFNYSSVPNNN